MNARANLFLHLPDSLWLSKRDGLLDAYRAEVLAEAANELDRIADTVEARVSEHYGPASGIGPGSAQMLRDAAGNVRYMAGEVTREGAPPTPAGPVQYGIRYGDGQISPVGGDREYAAGTRARMRATTDPDATLVQRTITASRWTLVGSEAPRD